MEILRQGVEAWNQWRADNKDVRPDLTGADLTEADLDGADFSEAYLNGAHLSGAKINDGDFFDADLTDADLSGAHLTGALLDNALLNRAHVSEADLNGADLFNAKLSGSDLRRAYLGRANFTGADLSNADLSSADLTDVIFNGTNLADADVSKAWFAWTTVGDVDLSQTKGLESARHEGPSTVGIDTIYQSEGRIPEVFLRGCGVPDDVIAFMQSLVGQPIRYYRCFISHSSKDRRFCDRLRADLQSRGVSNWYFPEDAKWGAPVWGEIDRAIKIYDKLVVVCSKNSLQSGPVCREIDRALNREDREGKSILFPIRIDNYLFDQWEHPRKADVLAKVVGDFSAWRRSQAQYDKALALLLHGLKADNAKPNDL